MISKFDHFKKIYRRCALPFFPNSKAGLVCATLLALTVALTLSTQPAVALQDEGAAGKKIEKVRLGYSALSFAVLPLFLSAKQGFFNQENLAVELIQARSNVAIAAILSGHMQFTSATVSSAAAAARGVPMKVLAVMNNRALQYVITKSDITTPAQLKGKKISVDSFGGTTHVIINQMLRNAGLNPEKDVQVLGGADATARFAQLKSGVVDATMLSPPLLFVARNEGFRILSSAKNMPELPSTGLATSEALLREKPEQVTKMLRAFVRGLVFLRENRDETIRYAMELLKLNRVVAEESYDLSRDCYSKDGGIGDQGFQLVIELQRDREGIGAKNIPVTQMANFAPLREVQKQLRAAGVLK
ncbi:MAG: ABC transporter substrate-binding protein [Alphaproteobacteria bacterium]